MISWSPWNIWWSFVKKESSFTIKIEIACLAWIPNPTLHPRENNVLKQLDFQKKKSLVGVSNRICDIVKKQESQVSLPLTAWEEWTLIKTFRRFSNYYIFKCPRTKNNVPKKLNKAPLLPLVSSSTFINLSVSPNDININLSIY